ncbi:PREDICTED: protein p13 MTCP-1-like [Myotis davidii]|uniref:protein p13 MTCP-1-like n=1 Tax=Myotis davidii TaxID=225400 RepID=UPI0003EBBC9B|nr:PREDICTED: protein p13 MTCP-1-like [Myotis davidii]
MAELPTKVHVTSHPICLRILGHSVYQDAKQRTWVHLVMETGGVLQVRLQQEDIPSGHVALTTSPLTSSTMALMWTIHPGNQYLDCMCRSWHIVHHIKEDEMEEMILELMEGSEDR